MQALNKMYIALTTDDSWLRHGCRVFRNEGGFVSIYQHQLLSIKINGFCFDRISSEDTAAFCLVVIPKSMNLRGLSPALMPLQFRA